MNRVLYELLVNPLKMSQTRRQFILWAGPESSICSRTDHRES